MFFRRIFAAMEARLAEQIDDMWRSLENRIETMSDTLQTELAALKSAVARETEVNKSATLLITGFNDRLNAAVQAAQAKGASPEMLSDLTELTTQLENSAQGLAAAVAMTGVPAADASTPAADGSATVSGGSSTVSGAASGATTVSGGAASVSGGAQ